MYPLEGARQRKAESKLRQWLSPGEQLLGYDVGGLSDGTAARVLVSARAFYVVTPNARTFYGIRAHRVARWSLANISTLLAGSELNVAKRDGEPFRLQPRRMTKGGVSDFVLHQLMLMPAYKRSATIEGDIWSVSFHPWRPGGAASWVEEIPAGVGPDHPARYALLDAAVADVEAIAAGQQADPNAVLSEVPEVSIVGLRTAWAHYLGMLDPDSVVLTQSDYTARTTILALQAKTVWVIDTDATQRHHPRLRAFDAAAVHVLGEHSSSFDLFTLVIGDQADSDTYFVAAKDEASRAWIRRLEAVSSTRQPPD
ncbi:hypothetical protein ACFPH6_16285 [Streptomyces xiangluensis]|uniref:PH domain-containing protein n=1 Tax=Streptomyces xiangluensis TaxID=2665720 RepID=A0ABV8YSF9_9ACTN